MFRRSILVILYGVITIFLSACAPTKEAESVISYWNVIKSPINGECVEVFEIMPGYTTGRMAMIPISCEYLGRHYP